MSLIPNHFKKFLFEVIGTYYTPLYQTDTSIYTSDLFIQVNQDLQKLEPVNNNPFKFFDWFFRKQVFDNQPDHPLSNEGQKLFVDFFRNYHMVAFEGQLYNARLDEAQLYHSIHIYSDPTGNDYTIEKRRYGFQTMLENLLNFHFHVGLAIIEENVEDTFNTDSLNKSLRTIHNKVERIKRVRLSQSYSPYNDVLATKFSTYIQMIDDELLSKQTVVKQSSTGQTKKEIRLLKLRAVFDGLEFDKGKWIVNTEFRDLRELLLENKFERKIMFGADQGRCVFALMTIMEDLEIKTSLTTLCNEGCLRIEGKERPKTLSNADKLYPSAHQIPDQDKIKAQIQELYKQIYNKN